MEVTVGLIISLECGIALVTLMIINFMLGGLLGPFVKVKMSRGKLIMVKALNPTQSYFTTGQIDEGFIVWKDRKKQDRRIKYTAGGIDRAAGVNWIVIDDEKNCIVNRFTGDGIDGFDAVMFDELLKRALYKPLTAGDKILLLVAIMVGVGLLIGIAATLFAFRGYQNTTHILAMLEAPVRVGAAALNNTVI